MEDVYLAQKRNVNGGAFGFVRFRKVKDVEKLLMALNNVYFGDWRVVAKVASFDRFGNSKGEGRERGEGDKRRDGGNNFEGEKRKADGGKVNEGEKRKDGGNDLVVGGEVLCGETGKRRVVAAIEEVVEADKVHVPKYTSTEQDVAWAGKGMVVTVLNGVAIPLLQRQIYDAGFENLVIIPLGADKVLLRLEDEGDVSIFCRKLLIFLTIFSQIL